jgi:hypothetical protein
VLAFGVYLKALQISYPVLRIISLICRNQVEIEGVQEFDAFSLQENLPIEAYPYGISLLNGIYLFLFLLLTICISGIL